MISSIQEDAFRAEQEREERCQRVAERAAMTNKLIREFRENPDNTYEKLLEVIGEKTFDLLMKGEEPQLDTLSNMAKLVVSVQGHRLKEREMKLEERKYDDQREADLAERQQAACGGGVTEPVMDKVMTSFDVK